MKTEDIKVGEHYAFYWNKYSPAQQVEVLEVGVPRTIRTTGRHSSRMVRDGVRVQPVAEHEASRLIPVSGIVQARQIRWDWASEEKAATEQQDRIAQRDERERKAEQAQEIFKTAGFDAEVNWSSGLIRVSLAPDDALHVALHIAKLVEQVTKTEQDR